MVEGAGCLVDGRRCRLPCGRCFDKRSGSGSQVDQSVSNTALPRLT